MTLISHSNIWRNLNAARNPGGDPTKVRATTDPEAMTSLSSVAATADMTRSLVTTLPPVFIGVAYLYHKGVIEGRDASWGATDLVIVTAVAYATTSFGVSNRWGGS